MYNYYILFFNCLQAYLTGRSNRERAVVTSSSSPPSPPSPPSVSWQFDFSECGLSVKSVLIKARHKRSKDGENLVTFCVEGDKECDIKRTMAFGGKKKNILFVIVLKLLLIFLFYCDEFVLYIQYGRVGKFKHPIN